MSRRTPKPSFVAFSLGAHGQSAFNDSTAGWRGPPALDSDAVAFAKAHYTGLTPTNAFGSVIGAPISQRNNYDEETVRGDYNINDHNPTVSARAFLNFFNQPPGWRRQPGANRPVLDQSLFKTTPRTWTWTVNPHIVNTRNRVLLEDV